MIPDHDATSADERRGAELARGADDKTLELRPIQVLELQIVQLLALRDQQPGLLLEEMTQILRTERLLLGILNRLDGDILGEVTLRALAGRSTLAHVGPIDLHRGQCSQASLGF